ncbi:MAG: methyltransferase domain-containing protein [Candidatus Omnitrophica bacterium]|nr:methyltransferase domain-containing protein [Candidatus Omnitrophota bacterium]MBU1997387.1 methyltransferase domain-containing protein [Candidatus Omnitrophota bacterium]MBU4334637.1 methyltransferase domain-containing protein [Candidatus Omnitrophota bacterium]
MTNSNEQIKFWQDNFGKEYTGRNTFSIKELDRFYLDTYGVTRSTLNTEFLGNLDKDIKILEVGCNIAQQLRHLQQLGFKNLYGIEIQHDAIEKAKSLTKDINIIYGSGLDIPFKDNWFDLVFTSGVLIHIAPENIDKVINEIYRCTNKHVWGFEYYSENLEEIDYRGNKGFLWKNDFCQLFVNNHKDLKKVMEKKIKYTQNDNVDMMYLLEKV